MDIYFHSPFSLKVKSLSRNLNLKKKNIEDVFTNLLLEATVYG